MARPRPPIGSPRDYLEAGLLEVLSRYGGDIIVAGPRMEALIVDLADFVEAEAGRRQTTNVASPPSPPVDARSPGTRTHGL